MDIDGFLFVRKKFQLAWLFSILPCIIRYDVFQFSVVCFLFYRVGFITMWFENHAKHK